MAIATAVSQPGREWMPADLYEALVLRPTAAGEWVRKVQVRRGADYVIRKIAEMLRKAQRLVAARPLITGRADAALAVTEMRDRVEEFVWAGQSGGVDLKNLTARLELCQKAGGLEHNVSARKLAELMGCSLSTAQNSNKRLRARGWLVLLVQGRREDASRWVVRRPGDPGTPPAPPRGQLGGVPATRTLASVMAEDAFHHFALGTSGARIYSVLDAAEGRTVQELVAETGYHRRTVCRRLQDLLAADLVWEDQGVYYRCQSPSEAPLDRIAQAYRTRGAGERRGWRHEAQRLAYRMLRQRRRRDRARRLVPEGVVDTQTGELKDPRWAGWDVSDPARPVWPGNKSIYI
ncbi:helix-turn-helix domain-containing protein [Streptomyces fractus]|uniref:helix-turn-helix domain-containing protein n=1 Tax=Streptomyces fractus TaxID=641806 RepID=UPI003CF0FEB7